MTPTLLQIAAALVLLCAGGEALIRGASALAERAGDLAVMVGLALLVAPLLWTRMRLSRLEGGILLTLFALYTAWLLARA